ncbi:MAG: translocation/assembly module TamB domain-containing protein [Paludibacteraceae bacterium]|nr:translocation/assembly module TamB domain-containing protein [Paludibacteraceae bacterium]
MKRALTITGITLAGILLVCGLLVCILMSNAVETAIVQRVTKELARTLGTQAHIGKVEYHLPARLRIQDIYIEDQQHDTLVYVAEVYAHFRPLSLREDAIRFSHLHVRDAVLNTYLLPDSTWNYQFLADAFTSDKKNEPKKNLVSLEDIDVENVRARVEDWNGRIETARVDLHELTDIVLDVEVRKLKGELTKRGQADRFTLKDLQAHVIFNDTMLAVPKLALQLPRSYCNLNGIEIRYPVGDTLNLIRSAHEIDFKVQLHEACLVASDLALLVPQLSNVKSKICAQGELSGRLDSLHANGLSVQYDGNDVFAGDMFVAGLPDLNNSYIRANFQDIYATAPMLQDMLSQLTKKPVKLPDQLHRLGGMHYRGLAEGYLHDIRLQGAFMTALGIVTTNGQFMSDSTFETLHYDARVVARNYRFGYLLGVPEWTSATVDVQTNGVLADGQARGKVKGKVSDFIYKDYTYDELTLDGNYSPQQFNGRFDIDDDHLKLAFNGNINYKEKSPEVNFELICRHFDSAPFGIASLGDGLRTRFKLSVDMNGVNPDRMSGNVVLSSLFLATPKDSIQMNKITLLVSAAEDHNKAITLKSDYLTAQVDGIFRYTDIAPAMQNMIHHYLPSAVVASKKEPNDVHINLAADGYRLRDLQRLFTAPVTLSDHPTLRASVDIPVEGEPHVDMRFHAPGVRAMNTPLHDLTVIAATVDKLIHNKNAEGSGLSLSVAAEAMQMQTAISCLAFRDTVLTHVTLRQQAELDEKLPNGWRDLTPRQLQRALSKLDWHDQQRAMLNAQRAGVYGGDLHLITHFSRYVQKPLIDMHILPSSLTLRDSVYTISESRIAYCAADTSLQVQHFAFEGGGQYLFAHGTGSRRASDVLSVNIKGIDASYVVPFVLPVQTIMFNGILNGKADIASLFRKPSVEAKIHVDSMGLNNCYFGEAEVDLHLRDKLRFHADVMRPTRKVVDLEGVASLFDGSGAWKLDMRADSVPIDFVNHWTSSVLDNLQGYASGRVCVGGKKNEVYVLMRAAAQDASFTLPWTGCRYTIHGDTLVMDTTSVRFPHVHVTDAEGHLVEVNGAVYHKQFQNFRLNIHADARDALVFDFPDKEGEMLQGHVYATGHADVTGDEMNILVDADAVTSGKSRFRLNLDNTSSAYESNFIHFVAHADSTKKDEEAKPIETDLDNIDIVVKKKKDNDEYKREGRCQLALNIEVNPKLLFQLVLGERTGDMIQGRGSGALRATYDTETGDVRLLGTCDIEQGTLSYTVANVIRREFNVASGSTIIFSGDATNPQLDVTAQYKVTANLKDLFGDEIEQIGTTRSNIPVLTCLHMTGSLNNPILNFSLELPLSDHTIQQQVRQVINTDEMLMRQVIYLLVFNRFFTPDYMSQAQYATLNSTYSLLSSTVTGQINSWLGKLSDVLTLGVAIRADGEGADASQEYEAQIQLHPVDRLVINGNVGYRYNDVSNQPFFGDLDVELLLTEDGQWRLKGYTHTVDKYSLRQASTIQGFGLLWKKDFNVPSKEERATKKAERKNKKDKEKK